MSISLIGTLANLLSTTSQNLLQDPSLLDPVSKLRVSMPQALIDTDFEYGIQNTKWETLVLYKNTPTYYYKNFSVQLPVTATSVSTGSTEVIVTSFNHGLPVGTPIQITGLKTSNFEGTYVIRKVYNADTFSYNVLSPSLSNDDVTTPYTICIICNPYTDAKLPYNRIFTDGLSNVIVETTSNVQLTVNNNYFNFINLLNRRRLFVPIDGSNVRQTDVLMRSNIFTVSNLSPGEVTFTYALSNSYLASAIVPYNWISSNVNYFAPNTSIQTALSASNINMVVPTAFNSTNNYAVFIQVPPGNPAPNAYIPGQGTLSNVLGGGQSIQSNVFFATQIGSNVILYSNANFTLGSNIVFTSNAANTANQPILMMSNLTEISSTQSVGGLTLFTTRSNLISNTANTAVVLCALLNNTAAMSNINLMTNNIVNSTFYYITNSPSANTFYLSNVLNGPAISNVFFTGGPSNVFVITGASFPANNSIYIGNTYVSYDSNVANNVVFFSNTIIGGVSNTQIYNYTVIPGTQRIQLSNVDISNFGNTTTAVFSTIYNMYVTSNINPTSPGEVTFNYNYALSNSYLASAIVPYNWISSNINYFAPNTSIQTALSASNINMVVPTAFNSTNNYAVFIQVPPGNPAPMGNIGSSASLNSVLGGTIQSNVLLATQIGSNVILYSNANFTLGSNIVFTSNAANIVNQPILMMSNLTEISNIRGYPSLFTTRSNLINNVDGSPFVFLSLLNNSASITGVTITTNNLVNTPTYYMRILPGVNITGNTFYVSTTPSGAPIANVNLVPSTASNVFVAWTPNFPENNSIFLPNHKMSIGLTTIVNVSGNAMVSNGNYLANVISTNRFKLLSNGNVIDLGSYGGVANYTLTPIRDNNRFSANASVLYLQNHGIGQNDIVKFFSNANTFGISNNSTYYAKVVDSNNFRIVSNTFSDFKIQSFQKYSGLISYSIDFIPSSQNKIETGLVPFTIGDTVLVSNVAEYTPLNGLHSVVGVDLINSNVTVQPLFSNLETFTLISNTVVSRGYLARILPITSNGLPGDTNELIDYQPVSNIFKLTGISGNLLYFYDSSTQYSNAQIVRFDPVNGNAFTTANVLYIQNHGFADGTSVTYNCPTNGNLWGISNTGTYFTVVLDRNTVTLANTFASAIARIQNVSILSNVQATGNHFFTTNILSTAYLAQGLLNSFSTTNLTSFTSNSLLRGTNTRLQTFLVPNDTFILEQNQSRLNVASIINDTYLNIDYDLPQISNGSTFLFNTSILPLNDSFIYHRVYDGGVQLTPGLQDGQTVVRQTHTQFRYQSGKGLQMSTGTNFSAPNDISNLVSISNNIVTVTTARPHFFINNTFSNVTISGWANSEFNSTSNIFRVIDNSTFSYKFSTNFMNGFAANPIPQTNNCYIYAMDSLSNTILNSGAIKVGQNVFTTYSGNIVTVLGFSNATATVGNVYPTNLSNIITLSGVFSATGGPTIFEIYPNVTSVNQLNNFPKYAVNNNANTIVRVGLFDSQNGLFFEYSNNIMYCVRRSATSQLGGRSSIVFKSPTVTGTGTMFTKQVSVGDTIVIRGMSYQVSSVVSDTVLNIVPSYRSTSSNNIIVSRVIDYKVPQSQWSIDKMDGTGASGYNIDIHKMQMCYIDFAWYGAGKARYGFKNTNGKVYYCNEIVHNNQMNEAYMRSGNLPARYEVGNNGIPGCLSYLSHWGTSVIMDGKFDDDKAYSFIGDSNFLVFTNGSRVNFSANTVKGSTTITGVSVVNSQYLKPGSVLQTTTIGQYNSNILGIAPVYTIANTVAGSSLITVSNTFGAYVGMPLFISLANPPTTNSSFGGLIHANTYTINSIPGPNTITVSNTLGLFVASSTAGANGGSNLANSTLNTIVTNTSNGFVAGQPVNILNTVGSLITGLYNVVSIPAPNSIILSNALPMYASNFYATGTAYGNSFMVSNTSLQAFQTGTSVVTSTLDPLGSGSIYTATISKPANATLTTFGNVNNNIQLFPQTSVNTYSPIPLLSVRLAPSVDSGTPGNLGARDILNRMQLTPTNIAVSVTHESIVTLFLNGEVTGLNWSSVYTPSLSQIAKHQIGDQLLNGIVVYSFRASGGSLGTASSNIARNIETTRIDLSGLTVLSNSVFGGNDTFPNGPDVLTVCVTPVDTTNISAAAPFIVGCKFSWAESQA